MAEQLTADGGWNVEMTFIFEIASTSVPKFGGKTSDGDR